MFRRYQGVFRSRWKALAWAAGVCLTAYCTVPREEQSEPQQAAERHSAHVNPWAVAKKG